MKLIFSRKGFDSGSGGAASPIVDGRPISLPIPVLRGSGEKSGTSYADIGLGDLVAKATRGRLTGADFCHHDPFHADGRFAFGQEAAAQGHLANQGVGAGDVFLFFGLFSDADGNARHHRIFGYMTVDDVLAVGGRPDAANAPIFAPRHPHFFGQWKANNTVYLGRGALAQRASDRLRLTAPGEGVSVWTVPPWLKQCGLTYHQHPARWLAGDRLKTVGRGQEFVTDIGGC
ncbi:MAG: hypothetical protein ACRCY3_09375, partial [Sphingorhabdus sp.]